MVFVKRWPLWLQLTSAMVGVSVIVAIAAGEMMRTLEKDYLRDELRRQSLRTSQAITIALSDTVASGQVGELETLVSEMHREDAFIHSVALLDMNQRTISRWVGVQDVAPGAMFYFSLPSEIPNRGPGLLVVSWNVAGVLRRIEAHVSTLRLNMILTVAVLGVLLVTLVQYLVVRPMTVLGRGLDDLARGDSERLMNLPPLAASDMDRLARSVADLGRYQRELRETQKSLDAARREAELASEAKGRFLAVMSHEIRTPLNGVVGSLDLLADATFSSGDKRLLANAQRSVDSLLEIINEILDFSRIEAGGVELERVEIDLETQLNDAAGAVAALVDHDRVELVVDLDPALPARVEGDPLRLRQVVTNLLANAIKFTEEGCVVLTATYPHEGWMRIEIADTGIGIPEFQQAHLFSPFTQADSSTSRRFGGTGLGLSICKQLVELMGGTIGVQSWPGEGSTFWFEVPVDVVEPTRTFSHLALEGRRALLVESDPFTRKAVVSYLASLGLDVSSVEQFSEVRSWLEGRVFPVQFLIIGTRLDSPEIVRAVRDLREMSGDPLVRLIAMVPPGQAVPSDVVDGFVLKPVRRAELLAALTDEPLEDVVNPPVDLSEETSPAPQTARILAVDDNPMNLQVARAMLERLGLEVHTAESGEEALSLMDQLSFRLILMDDQMPGMDGQEATRRIRARSGADAATPVVALTANADAESERRCLDAGMDGFLGKPVRRKALRVVLSRWLPEVLDAPAGAAARPGG